jgi:hypothetical protein
VSHDDSLHLDQGFGSLIGDNLLKSIGIGCIISPNLQNIQNICMQTHALFRNILNPIQVTIIEFSGNIILENLSKPISDNFLGVL